VAEPPRNDPKPPGRSARAVSSSPADPPTMPRIDLAAPNWLTQLLKPKPAPIDWKRAIRALLAITTPIALGLAVGQLAIGILISIGSLCAAMTAISGPYRDRLRRTGPAVLAGAVGFFLGDLAGNLDGGSGWWTVGLVVLAGVVSAVISAAGNNASVAGLQLLVFLVLGTHEAGTVNPGLATGLFAIGALWTLALILAAWPVHATAPERALVAGVYDKLAGLLAVSGTPAAHPARRGLTDALNQSYDALLAARSRLQGRDSAYRSLFTVLTETTPVIEASVALSNAHHRPPRAVVEAVAALGRAIRADEPPPELDLPRSGSPAVLTLEDGLRQVVDTMAGRRETDPTRRGGDRPTRRQRLSAWYDQVIAGPATWQHALRLALCLAIGGVLVNLLPLDRSYWVFLTIAIVLKPDFGSVFARAVLRGGGTFVGVLLGAGLLAWNPNGWVLVALVALIAFLLPIAQVRNYGMFSTVLTPLVVIQLDLAAAGSGELVLARLLDTLVGCAVVLIFGYLCWPGSRAPRIGPRLADAVDAVGRYADTALRADPRGRSTLRRRTYRQLADLRTEFQRVLVEPFPAGRLAAAWYPAIVTLERAPGSITRVALELERGAAIPPDPEVDALVAGFTEVARAIRDQRDLPDPPRPATAELAAIAADLAMVVSALRGPDLTTLRPFALLRRWIPGVRPT
jgi:uncharacterized membrane protein YccC